MLLPIFLFSAVEQNEAILNLRYCDIKKTTSVMKGMVEEKGAVGKFVRSNRPLVINVPLTLFSGD